MSTDRSPPGGAPVTRSERRYPTIVFVDFEASSVIASRTDPEVFASLTADAQGRIAETIESTGGTVAKLMGDGLLAYFGAPIAHEDDAFRAVAAALDFTARLQEGATAGLAVRTGVHTGLVVVGPVQAGGTRHERDVLGAAPSIAARIQGAAGPNEVVISPATEELVRDRFRTERLVPRELRGVAGPMALFRVIGLREDVDLDPGVHLAPFLGRKREMRTLLEAWEDTQAGESRVCVVSGEPGIGKSRLKREFLAEAKVPAGQIVRWTGIEARRAETFWAIEDWLRRDAARPDDLPAPHAAETLLELLRAGPESVSGAVTADRFHQEVVERVRARIERLAARAPLCLVVDDLQWADRGTLDVLASLVDTPQAPPALFVLALHRTPFPAPWQPRAHVHALVLSRLARAPAEAIVAAVTRDALPPADVAAVLANADGVPLFLEELSRYLFDEHGYRALQATDAAELPARLATLLTARLDALGPARTAARFAAVLGDSFTLPQLAAVMQAPLPSLADDIRTLEAAGICYRQPTLDNQYGFRHRLIRDAAYNVLSLAERTRIHGRIADELRDTLPPQTLAFHLARARRPEGAIAAYLAAIKQAVVRHRWHQAAAVWRDAMDELAGTPETVDLARLLRASQGLAINDVLSWSEWHTCSARALAIFEANGASIPAAREHLSLAACSCSEIRHEGPFSPPTALEHLQEAERLLTDGGTGFDQVVLHAYRAEAYRLRGDTRARDDAARADAIAREVGLGAAVVIALLTKGAQEFSDGYPQDAQSTWDEAVALTLDAPGPELVGTSYTILMQQVSKGAFLHEYAGVHERLERELALNRQGPSNAAALRRLAGAFAFALGQAASPPASEAGVAPGIAETCVLLSEGRLGAARDALSAHALRMRTAGAASGAAEEVAMVGAIEILLGRPEAAIDQLTDALELAPGVAPTREYAARAWRAFARALAGQTEPARADLDLARDLLSAPSLYFRGIECATEALIEAADGEAETARRTWDRAQATFDRTGVLMDRALGMRAGACVLARAGDHAGAAHALEQAPVVLRGHGWSDDWEAACRAEGAALGLLN